MIQKWLVNCIFLSWFLITFAPNDTIILKGLLTKLNFLFPFLTEDRRLRRERQSDRAKTGSWWAFPPPPPPPHPTTGARAPLTQVPLRPLWWPPDPAPHRTPCGYPRPSCSSYSSSSCSSSYSSCRSCPRLRYTGPTTDGPPLPRSPWHHHEEIISPGWDSSLCFVTSDNQKHKIWTEPTRV